MGRISPILTGSSARAGASASTPASAVASAIRDSNLVRTNMNAFSPDRSLLDRVPGPCLTMAHISTMQRRDMVPGTRFPEHGAFRRTVVNRTMGEPSAPRLPSGPRRRGVTSWYFSTTETRRTPRQLSRPKDMAPAYLVPYRDLYGCTNKMVLSTTRCCRDQVVGLARRDGISLQDVGTSFK